jgi:hypothetical protein
MRESSVFNTSGGRSSIPQRMMQCAQLAVGILDVSHVHVLSTQRRLLGSGNPVSGILGGGNNCGDCGDCGIGNCIHCCEARLAHCCIGCGALIVVGFCCVCAYRNKEYILVQCEKCAIGCSDASKKCCSYSSQQIQKHIGGKAQIQNDSHPVPESVHLTAGCLQIECQHVPVHTDDGRMCVPQVNLMEDRVPFVI